MLAIGLGIVRLMTISTSSSSPSVRRVLGRRRLTGSLAVATAAATAAAVAMAAPGAATTKHPAASGAKLPIHAIEKIEQADGTVSGGVLSIAIDREKLKEHLHGVRLKPSFEITHELFFQSIGNGRAAFNGELAVLPGQQQKVIDAIQRNHLVLQAEHQHFTDIHPMIWFMHYRGTGTPRTLAARVHRVITSTGVHLPQSSPKHPKTPLPAHRLAKILGGTAEKEAGGVVAVDVDRSNTERLAGRPIKPGLGVGTTIEFQPLGKGGRALVVPDFGMTSEETQPVIRTMRARHWKVECLYNQETAEHPQLYFSHMVKKGNAVVLAHQIRLGLDHMAVSG